MSEQFDNIGTLFLLILAGFLLFRMILGIDRLFVRVDRLRQEQAMNDSRARLREELFMKGLEYLQRRLAQEQAEAQTRTEETRDYYRSMGSPLQTKADLSLLGLQQMPTNRSELRTAYMIVIKRAHPDQGGSVAAAALVNAARDRLKRKIAA